MSRMRWSLLHFLLEIKPCNSKPSRFNSLISLSSIFFINKNKHCWHIGLQFLYFSTTTLRFMRGWLCLILGPLLYFLLSLSKFLWTWVLYNSSEGPCLLLELYPLFGVILLAKNIIVAWLWIWVPSLHIYITMRWIINNFLLPRKCTPMTSAFNFSFKWLHLLSPTIE